MGRVLFSDDIVRSDAFLDMPKSAQCLYYNLNFDADNDGFIGNPRSAIRTCDCSGDDYQELIDRRFIIVFDSGVAVIKHWWINNTRRTDRYQQTRYQDELAGLIIKVNGAYSKKSGNQPSESGNLTEHTETEQNRTEQREGAGNFQVIVDEWNAVGLSKITTLSKSRKEKIKLRIKEIGEDSVIAAIRKIPLSRFLMGHNDRKWKCSFDWLFDNDKNILKVLEGNYSDGGKILNPVFQNMMNQIEREKASDQ